MNIREFSQLTNVSAHTLRYYEKIGLLRPVKRTAGGHRFFTPADIDWVAFIKRLKDMGMSLENIQRYAVLREKGDSTFRERMQLLQDHVLVVEERLATDALHLKKLKDKIDYYGEIIDNSVNG